MYSVAPLGNFMTSPLGPNMGANGGQQPGGSQNILQELMALLNMLSGGHGLAGGGGAGPGGGGSDGRRGPRTRARIEAMSPDARPTLDGIEDKWMRQWDEARVVQV